MKLPDLDIINNSNLVMANSARQMAEIESAMNYINTARIERETEKHNAILQTAEFTGQQKELLEKQLEEVKQQNAQLKENYALLKDLYDRAKQDAEESAKDAKRNRVFGWVSFAVGTFIGIAGVILGIIF